MKTLIHETDWLASTPFFYNLKRGTYGESIQTVIPKNNLPDFHPEGLFNFLDFGYSILEQTPLNEIRFLRHSSRLWRSDSGTLEVEYLDDLFQSYEDHCVTESDIIELIRDRVQKWEASLPSDQEILLPLSGGYDSRLLLWCLRDPSRVQAYTYGLSEDQSMSTEVIRAQTLARRFNIRWKQIQLGDFHHYFQDWDAHFGLSTHAHGMYHIEFYTKIRERINGEKAFLSGIFGDVWAGSISPCSLKNAMNLEGLGYTHGLRADPTKLRLPVSHEIRECFWIKNRSRLNDHRFQIVTTIRLKIMLISYLMRVPRLFGFQPWSPYLDIDIATAMLNLPQKRRANRQWQRDFFRKVGLDMEHQGPAGSRQNNLNIQALRRVPLNPLDKDLLSKLVEPSYIDWVNKQVRITCLGNLLRSILAVPKIGGALRLLGMRDRTLPAYFAYLCLRPIETYLRRKSFPSGGC